MTNPTRTRAEIQAEIEKLQEELEGAWPSEGAAAYLKATVNQIDSDTDGIADVKVDGDEDIFQVYMDALIPAADLITREEHERAVAEARADTKQVVAHFNARDAIAYLVKEYDLDTGHQDSAEPRQYHHNCSGYAYEVIVRRQATGIPQPLQKTQQLAVAPKGVVAEIKRLALAVGRAHTKIASENAEIALCAALARITELPEPSKSYSEWARLNVLNQGWTANELKQIAAALLAKEGDHE